MLLLCSLRGSITIWQGEELGLPQVDVPFDKLQDPEAIANWPQTLSRDGARTPMPWQAGEANLGFSTGEPWLPVGETHVPLSIDRQQADEGSMLNFTRRALQFRRDHSALREGSLRILEASDNLLSFERSLGHQRLRCTFNLSEDSAPFSTCGKAVVRVGDIDGGSIGPYAAVIEEIE